MARSLAVLAFVGLVAACAILVSQRPTVGRGEVLAADLLASNKTSLDKLECDPEIPIGVDGARFWCRATFKVGNVKRLQFKLDRAGGITKIAESDDDAAHP